jgi:hypothetical protein
LPGRLSYTFVLEPLSDVEDDAAILGEFWALRRVHPDLVKPSTGEPDRSVFKDDPGGVGTSITLWLSGNDLRIVTGGRDDVGVVAVPIQAFRDQGLGVAYTHEEGNPHHCEVFGARTKGKLRTLREQAQWVQYPVPFPEEHLGECLALDSIRHCGRSQCPLCAPLA